MRRGTITFTTFAPLATLILCFAVSGCRSKPHRTDTREQTPASPAATSPDLTTLSGYELFHKQHPKATVLQPLDPHTLTESQIKFGVSPRRDPSVEYQPNIILMENGDKAIKSIAGDGLTWTFDANAPQVGEFQVDKIVFATGRAVGRVLALKRQGNNVQVVLGPVELTDLIRNGTFEMDAAVDLNSAVSYIAPDYPQPSDDDQQKISLNNHGPATHARERVVLARVSPHGRWVQSRTGHTFADEHRGSSSEEGGQWRPGSAHLLRLSSNSGARNMGSYGPRILRTAFQQLPNVPKLPKLPKIPTPPKIPNLPQVPSVPKGIGNVPGVLNAPIPGGQKIPGTADAPYGPTLHLPGIPGVEGISPLKIVEEPFDPPKLMGQVPIVELAGGKAIPINGSDTSVGMEYKYDQDGLHVLAKGKLILGESKIKFFLHINNGGVEDCGISLKGNMAIQLRLNAMALDNFTKDFHKTLYLPIDVSLPLGGPVPLSLTFTSSFVLHSAFSAKGSVLNAKGDYSFGAGMDAGYWSKQWRFNAGAAVKADTNIGDTIEGISVGWNSAILGFGERALVGVGAFGLKAGVFVAVRFAGSAAKAPNITFPCRQGTMDISLETGVGYSIAEWLQSAINFFLKPLTDKTVDRAGTFLRGPVKSLYHDVTQVPKNCINRGSG
jgi:hypothetical protein